MKEKIIEVAKELFLNFGFKSVTMDDLASEMGISKKTIYAHFPNKTKLVEATTSYIFDQICAGIDSIIEENHEPIEELYHIKSFIMQHLKNEKTSPQYQLQKYYPKLYTQLKSKQFDVTKDCVAENITRGIEKGVYRSNIDPEIISRLYFTCVIGIKDQHMFPTEIFSIPELMENYLEYHIRGIASKKGLEILNNLIKDQQK
ncbi:TetR/AcrR family transcriptional regulator [Aquimarina hainanensis]|uniref:TetR/AcrR family transcriptional regulator n=1 Tax=Aquimarina hainanensis TaxID=1578017 RepID=A0ABW5N514_9FLAO|nr:TetR/AcrR family transcriptional regulator [Aquimarina sp. TRL1]QKX05050.1 TetR/AcrR family transcriptional regulator [Aquimarina sp. TRL1]